MKIRDAANLFSWRAWRGFNSWFWRRTLLYSLLTVILLLIYFGSVLLFQNIFEFLIGQHSSFVAILSTLVIAASFTPLRARLQSDIDRLFFRKAYDAEQAVQDFSAVIREDVDLDQIRELLTQTVRQALQPEFLSLWTCRVSSTRDVNDEEQIR